MMEVIIFLVLSLSNFWVLHPFMIARGKGVVNEIFVETLPNISCIFTTKRKMPSVWPAKLEQYLWAASHRKPVILRIGTPIPLCSRIVYLSGAKVEMKNDP